MIQKRQMIAAAAGVLLGYGIWAAAQNFGGTADGGAGNTGYGRMADAGGGAGAAGNMFIFGHPTLCLIYDL